MIKKIFLITLILGSQALWAQQTIVWQTLMLTQFETISMGSNEGLYKPNFPDVVKKLEGKEVIIAGFIIPVDMATNSYALSMSSFSSCFFCGNAGPNTVIELKFKETQDKFLVDQFVIIKGTFKLNRFNPRALFFIIEKAEIHG